ncbi:hypothetical protein PF005_g605 [Phytophthora fragariae]|uniref:Secreted protein n=2 Tax=Phytophthora TaxID=4783 RepID=A0A6A4AIE5_9STRA|nr:hypothetical protein PF003_g32809 [Phytophthora fragariae]KAE9045681.1 hypothetical protein PR002_g2096 [Phytophthora rubi]KAE8949626.1 hypothetical protein PF009_g832 [Phytophthora fragariae]KAE9030796.1 hypothetical protein PF011_g460 [Phytophthora fragariae]KAE9052907.1 hypothetical protein PR001_g97 [Phytophthora rubi]
MTAQLPITSIVLICASIPVCYDYLAHPSEVMCMCTAPQPACTGGPPAEATQVHQARLVSYLFCRDRNGLRRARVLPAQTVGKMRATSTRKNKARPLIFVVRAISERAASCSATTAIGFRPHV